MNTDSKHEEFTEWTKSQGVNINGVAPLRFSGKGMGIAALRKIEAGEIVVSVPISAMLTFDKIPLSFRERFPSGTSVQAIFAAYLCCEDEPREKYALWQSVWPSRQDFEDSMPVLWPDYLIQHPSDSNEFGLPFSLLPPPISGRWNTMVLEKDSPSPATKFEDTLDKQRKRLEAALRTVRDVFPHVDEDLYTYYWIISHTRCFYHVPVGAEAPEDRNDAMALCPFADYFNHTDEGCRVMYDENEYTFTATKSYEKGEEVFVCYGQHTSDTLLSEYGFVPSQNSWDSLLLDDIIMQGLSAADVEALELERYLGKYHITSSGPCFRTEMAACIKYMPLEDWEKYVQGYPPSSFSQEKTNSIIRGWIGVYVKEAELALERLRGLKERKEFKHDSRFEVLIIRWSQILRLCEDAMGSLES